MVLRDGRVGILGKVPLKKGANDSYAEAMPKEVVGSGGKQIIVVVNQQYEQEHGKVEADDLHWFRFRQWKVKWLKPEPETSDENENE